MKAADVHPAGYPNVVAIENMGKKLDAATNGRIKFQMFPGSVLGGEKEMIEQTQVGAIQILRTSLGPVGPVVPEVNQSGQRAVGAQLTVEAAHDAGLGMRLVEDLGRWQVDQRCGPHHEGFVGSRAPHLGQAPDVGLEDVGGWRGAFGQPWHAVIEQRNAGLVLRAGQRDPCAVIVDVDGCGGLLGQ